jgi:hypothetical protein
MGRVEEFTDKLNGGLSRQVLAKSLVFFIGGGLEQHPRDGGLARKFDEALEQLVQAQAKLADFTILTYFKDEEDEDSDRVDGIVSKIAKDWDAKAADKAIVIVDEEGKVFVRKGLDVPAELPKFVEQWYGVF